MTDQKNYGKGSGSLASDSHRFAYYSAILTTVITIVTFGFAMIAIPISGANCPGDCVEYPYLDTVSQFPRDFVWMALAMILVLAYVVLMVSIHAYASRQKRIFSQIGLVLAMIAAVVLLSDYYIQFFVIPMSLMNGETEGLAVLIQYNPHGVFLALEELGYLVMSLSFLFMAPVFANRSRLESAVRWVFVIAFVVAIISLAGFSIGYGFDKQDRFEVAVLSVDWLALIVNGILLSRVFRRQLRKNENAAVGRL
jgi:hypothetical protein